MLESAQKILSQYIDEPVRFAFEDIEIIRGDNPEDLFYISRLDGKDYVIYESDYIGDLSYIVKEIKTLPNVGSAMGLHWLVKKTHQTSISSLHLVADTTPETKELREAIIYSRDNSYLRYVVVELKS